MLALARIFVCWLFYIATEFDIPLHALRRSAVFHEKLLAMVLLFVADRSRGNHWGLYCFDLTAPSTLLLS